MTGTFSHTKHIGENENKNQVRNKETEQALSVKNLQHMLHTIHSFHEQTDAHIRRTIETATQPAAE